MNGLRWERGFIFEANLEIGEPGAAGERGSDRCFFNRRLTQMNADFRETGFGVGLENQRVKGSYVRY